MPKVTDVKDQAARSHLEEAEKCLDGGDYDDTVRRCADIYLRLIDENPTLVVSRRPMGQLTLGGRPPAPRETPWPDLVGVRLDTADDGKRTMAFEKEHFTMSDAVTCFEYVLETTIRSQP